MPDLPPNVALSSHPLVLEKISLLRDKTQPPAAFRALLHSLSTLLMYEATSSLALRASAPRTSPLATYQGQELATSHALVPILRSGLAMVDAASALLPDAQVRHLGLFREETSLLPIEYYNKLPRQCTVDKAFVLDPLVATGGTVDAAIQILRDWGVRDLVVVVVCASREGLAKVARKHARVRFVVGAVDEVLNDRGFVVPGIGDCGDRINSTL